MYYRKKILMGPAIGKGNFKPTKTILPGHGEFENLCFDSIPQKVRVSRAFLYNAVDINKIITVLLAKLLSYMNGQSFCGLLHSLLD